MQLPATDELVLISGLAPIRAQKLRYFADTNFTARVAPAPSLVDGRYADCPKPRSNDWGRFARLPDTRLENAAETVSADEDGGMQQQRHPGIAEDAGTKPVEQENVQQQIADDDGDGAAEKRAMDQARGLTPVARGYGLNQSSGRDLLPGI